MAFGQKRALIVWQRIILPDGSSLTIDNVPASDASRYGGLQDKVDIHTSHGDYPVKRAFITVTFFEFSFIHGIHGLSPIT